MLPFTIMQFNTVSAQIGKGPRAAISCEIEHTVFKGSVLRSFIKERTTSLIHSEVIKLTTSHMDETDTQGKLETHPPFRTETATPTAGEPRPTHTP